MKEPRVVFGFHAVLARLRADPRSVVEIFLDEGRQDGRARDLILAAERGGVKLHRVPTKRLDGFYGGARHQGVVARVEMKSLSDNLDDILAVSGVSAIMIGSNDLSGSMGHMGEPQHPDVIKAVDTVIQKCNRARMPVGMAVGHDPEVLMGWINKGVNWLMSGNDFTLMLHTADYVAGTLRDKLGATHA